MTSRNKRATNLQVERRRVYEHKDVNVFKRVGNYLLSHFYLAAFCAILFSAMPLFGWVAAVIVALVTLEQGARRGCVVMLCAMAPQALGMIFQGVHLGVHINSLAGSLYVWAIALVLRRKQWSLTWEVTILLAHVATVIVHGVMPDINLWWQGQINDLLDWFVKNIDKLQTIEGYLGVTTSHGPGALNVSYMVTEMKASHVAKNLSLGATGMVFMLLLMGNLFNVGLGRYWQMCIKGEKGFALELYRTRISLWMGVGVLLVGAATYLKGGFFWDPLVILLVGLLVVGLMLIHWLLRRVPMHSLILVVIYVGIILKPIDGLCIVMALGLLDSFINFRKRVLKEV